MAAGAILNFSLTAITRSLFHRFARNYAQGLKITSQKQICRNSDNIQDGGGGPLEILLYRPYLNQYCDQRQNLHPSIQGGNDRRFERLL